MLQEWKRVLQTDLHSRNWGVLGHLAAGLAPFLAGPQYVYMLSTLLVYTYNPNDSRTWGPTALLPIITGLPLFALNLWGNCYPWYHILDRIPFLVTAWLLEENLDFLLPRLTRRRVGQCAFLHLATAFVYTFTTLSYAGTFGRPFVHRLEGGTRKIDAVGIVGGIWAAMLSMTYYAAAAMRFLAWRSKQPIVGALTMGYASVPSMKFGWDQDRFVGQKPINARKFTVGRYDGWVV